VDLLDQALDQVGDQVVVSVDARTAGSRQRLAGTD